MVPEKNSKTRRDRVRNDTFRQLEIKHMQDKIEEEVTRPCLVHAREKPQKRAYETKLQGKNKKRLEEDGMTCKRRGEKSMKWERIN